MEIYNIVNTIITVVLGGGWFIYYRANKRKAEGEASQSEAEGWKKQQEVYQATISDLKDSCDFIRKDRDLLRDENEKLRNENVMLRDKIFKLEEQLSDIRRDIARQGRRIESLTNRSKNKKEKDN